jgi:uncharacterized membrane protein
MKNVRLVYLALSFSQLNALFLALMRSTCASQMLGFFAVLFVFFGTTPKRSNLSEYHNSPNNRIITISAKSAETIGIATIAAIASAVIWMYFIAILLHILGEKSMEKMGILVLKRIINRVLHSPLSHKRFYPLFFACFSFFFTSITIYTIDGELLYALRA